MGEPESSQKNARLRAAWLSFAAGVVMLFLKMGAYIATGSYAILSDAMESVVHIAATGFVVFSSIYAEQPADENYPYGRGKIEGFSVGFEGGLIMLAGVSIIWEAGRGFAEGDHSVYALDSGLWLIFVAALINIILGSYLVATGKKHNSAILKADGLHTLSDAYTSIGVIVGLFLVLWTDLIWIDGLVAILVALHLLKTGQELIIEACHQLMNRQNPELLQSIVYQLNKMREGDWRDIHQLRAQRSGCMTHVDFHLVVPASLSLTEAHKKTQKIKRELLDFLKSDGSVLIHLDPDDGEPFSELKESDGPFTVKSIIRNVKDD